MSLAGLLGQSCVVKHWTYVTDAYGNQERTTATELGLPCRLEQTDGREVLVGRNTEMSNYRIFWPPGAVVDAEDQVVLEGKTYEVIGPPAVERSPRGPHHMVADLRFVE